MQVWAQGRVSLEANHRGIFLVMPALFQGMVMMRVNDIRDVIIGFSFGVSIAFVVMLWADML